mgnify:CR=1 FL=1
MRVRRRTDDVLGRAEGRELLEEAWHRSELAQASWLGGVIDMQ